MTLNFLIGSIVVSVASILAGCATTPPTFEQFPEDRASLEKNWASAAETQVTLTESLLALFNDDSLSLLVEKSQQRNLSLLQQRSATEAISAIVVQANAGLFPELSTNIKSSRQDNGSAITENHSLTLDVSWELDLWGRVSAESDAAVADFEASKASYQSLKDSIAAQTMQAYIDAVSQSQLAALSKDKYQSFEKTLNVVTSQYQTGSTDLRDLTEARQNLASARVDDVESQLSQRNAIRTLQLLIGDYPNGVDFVSAVLPAMMHAPDAGIPSEVLARRPDVKAAWYSVQSAGWSVAAKDAAQLPNISLSSSLGKTSDSLKDLLSGDAIWGLAASIGYTLFDRDYLKAELAQTQSLADQVYYRYLETVLTALNEVETALDTEQAYYQYELAQRDVVSQASLLLDNAEQDYRDGLIDVSDWLTYQRSFFDEQSMLISTVNQRLQNRISLGLSLGLGV